jgi:NMD protein affecting ribosome stability and mRNA decay
VSETVEITCPRCGRTAVVAFYGPCDDCCAQLRAAYASSGHELEATRFEPKMHVIPNQVATKD